MENKLLPATSKALDKMTIEQMRATFAFNWIQRAMTALEKGDTVRAMRQLRSARLHMKAITKSV